MSAIPARDPSDLGHVDAAGLSALWPRNSSTAATPWRVEEYGDVLRHQLTVPIDDDAVSSAQAQQWRDVLLGPAVPAVEALRRIKEWAKPNMSRDDGDVPREVAGVLYFAAILAARLRLSLRISELDDERLREAGRWALQRSWLDSAMAELFAKGVKQLQHDAALL